MSRAPVTIVMTTYFPPGDPGASRVETAKTTLASWKKHLHYDGEIRLHIADDGSPVEHTKALMAYAGEFYDTGSRNDRHGVGASLNAGLRSAFEVSPLAAFFVDDWRLNYDFDLTPWADLLIDDETVGMVRFFPHPWISGTAETFAGGWGMRLDRHHYVTGHRPAIYHRRMFVPHGYGWFAEDVNAFDCETLFNEVFCQSPGPDIVLALPSPWEPTPDSIQLSHIDPRQP